MSRIGKKAIPLDGATVAVQDAHVTVAGPKGTLEWDLPEKVALDIGDAAVTVSTSDESRQAGATQGLVRSLLNGMVTGVTAGFKKELEIQGVGYRGQCNNNKLILSLGFSHPVEFQAPEGLVLSMPSPTSIVVEGIDKQKVGQAAATIRGFRPPDNYKGKGIRYVGERVVIKEGKTVG